ncbi:hypothetical protein Lepto7375DRAFT_2285 [Leptolyngbya sp. PCC 7375]|nr:hypothetical protein Lepto7375DRAFT_2285 [Leptolyngbya sp. PCC 7375]
MVWYLQLCMPSAHFLVDPYGFWVTGFVSGSQAKPFAQPPASFIAIMEESSIHDRDRLVP